MLDQIKIEIDQLIATGQLKEFHARLNRNHGFVEIKGRKLVDFTNWDFFALNENKKFLRTAQNEIEHSGFGSSSARLSSGTTLSHLSCEKRLAQFLNAQSSLLFSSKNQAVLSLMTAIATEGDFILFDEQIQSPVADAAFLMNANAISFNSSNLSSLETELQKTKGQKRRFILTESVSPLTGKKIEIKRLCQIAKKFDANLIVDESFALGLYGLRGAGLSEEAMLLQDIFCVYGSLAHCIPCYGAFLAGGASLINYVIQRSKTFTYEVSLPPCVSSAIESALDIVELSTGDRSRLATNIDSFRGKLGEAGFLDAKQSDSAIVTVMAGTTKKAHEVANILYQKGFLVDVISLQTTLTDIGLIRMIVSVYHSKESLDSLVLILSDITSKMGED